MSPQSTDPIPNHEPPLPAGPVSIQSPEVETLRAIYDRRRRRMWLTVAIAATVFTIALGAAAWLFIRYPLRAMREHGQRFAASQLDGEVAEKIRTGDDSGAADAMQKALALIDRNREPFRWASVARGMAGMLIAAKRYDEAHALLGDAVTWAEHHPELGPDARVTLELIATLADLEGEQHHDDAAESLLQRALATSERVFGEKDERTLMSLNDYGWFLVERSRVDEAEPLLQRCLSGMEKAGRGNSSQMASVLDSVAHLRDKQGRLKEAIELQRRAVKIGRIKFKDRASYLAKFTDYLSELEKRVQEAAQK